MLQRSAPGRGCTMPYAMQVFQDEDRYDFRVIDRDGEPWFVLADGCRKLGIVSPSDAATRLDDDEKMTLALSEGHSGIRGGARRLNLINESGLCSLVLRSARPEAKRFKTWITSDVLPSTRKTGTYGGRVPAFIRRYNENRDCQTASNRDPLSAPETDPLALSWPGAA